VLHAIAAIVLSIVNKADKFSAVCPSNESTIFSGRLPAGAPDLALYDLTIWCIVHFLNYHMKGGKCFFCVTVLSTSLVSIALL
jgi:hypothetical protein